MAIGHRSQQIPDGRWLVAFEHQIAQRKKIARALRHLLAFNQQESRMEPEMRELFAGQRFGLRYFIFVVRENQILAARMQIETLAEFLHGHDRALNVPARATWSDDALPRSLAGLGCFPECKVASVVFFVFVNINSRAVFHAGKISFGEFAVSRKFRNPEIIGTVFGFVGQPFLHQSGDELCHLRNVLGGTSDLRLFNMQCRRILEECFLILRCVLLHIDSRLGRVADNFVVHVSDVHDVMEFMSALAKVAAQNINRNEGTEIANVAVVVNRRPASVHADFVVHQRPEFLNFSRECVEQAKWHGVKRTFILWGYSQAGQTCARVRSKPAKYSFCTGTLGFLPDWPM